MNFKSVIELLLTVYYFGRFIFFDIYCEIIETELYQEQDDVKGNLAPDEDLYKVLKLLLEKEDQQNKDDLIRREWRMLAEIIDKWLFWGFFLITTLSTAIFIVILPYGKRGKFF